MLYMYIDLFVLFLDNFTNLCLYEVLSSSNKTKIHNKILLCLMISVFISLFNNTDVRFIVANIAPFIFLNLYGIFFVKNSILNSFLCTLTTMVNLAIVNSIFLLLGSLTYVSVNDFVFGTNELYVYSVVICNKIFIGIECFFLFNLKMSRYKIDRKVWKWLFFISSNTIVMIGITVYEYITNGVSFYFGFFTISLMLLTNILIYSLSMYVTKINFDFLESKLQLESIKHEEKISEVVQEKVKQLSKFRHDYNKHMSTIAFLVKDGNVDAAQKYIKGISIDEEVILFTTNNRVLNFLLSTNLGEADSLGIDTKYTIFGSNSTFIEDADLTAIISNLFSNAIEGTMKVDYKHISIHFDFSDIACAKLMIRNTSLPVKISSMGKIKTTKKDTKNHGIGMYSINDTISKYNGDSYYQYDKGMFTFTCNLYNKEYVK